MAAHDVPTGHIGAHEIALVANTESTVTFGADQPSVVVEEWPHPVEQPLGDTAVAHFARQDYLRTHDDAALLAAHFVLAPEVVQEQVGPPGAEDPEHVVLRQRAGFGHAEQVDTAMGGVLGACDGDLALAVLVAAVARLEESDAGALARTAAPIVRRLAVSGLLTCVE